MIAAPPAVTWLHDVAPLLATRLSAARLSSEPGLPLFTKDTFCRPPTNSRTPLLKPTETTALTLRGPHRSPASPALKRYRTLGTKAWLASRHDGLYMRDMPAAHVASRPSRTRSSMTALEP